MVGAGPAGLSCAYQLTKKGYGVTVFEALPVAGGMMAVGIPEYRLPRDVLALEIDGIRRLGVEIMNDSALGRDFTLDDLFRQGYRAVFLGIGADRGRKLKAPGEELPGVHDGLTFLREIALGGDTGARRHGEMGIAVSPPRGEGMPSGLPGAPGSDRHQQPSAQATHLGRVAVIGGGKTAVDAGALGAAAGGRRCDHLLPPDACRDARRLVRSWTRLRRKGCRSSA